MTEVHAIYLVTAVTIFLGLLAWVLLDIRASLKESIKSLQETAKEHDQWLRTHDVKLAEHSKDLENLAMKID